jgi:hypothetical protein
MMKMTKNIKPDQPAGMRSDQQDVKSTTSCNPYVLRFSTGRICPRCQIEKLEYNSMLQLTCPRCGIVEGGAFT